MSYYCNYEQPREWQRRWDPRCPIRGSYPWAVGSCGGVRAVPVPGPVPCLPMVPSAFWGCASYGPSRCGPSRCQETVRPRELDYRVGGPGNPSAMRRNGSSDRPILQQTIIVLGGGHSSVEDITKEQRRRRRLRRKRRQRRKKSVTVGEHIPEIEDVKPNQRNHEKAKAGVKGRRSANS